MKNTRGGNAQLKYKICAEEMSKKENKRHHKSILSQFWWEVWLNVWRRSRKAHLSMFLKGWGKLRNRGVCLPRSCTGTVIFSVLLRFITFNWQLWLPTDESKLLHNQISCKTKKVIKYHIVQIFVPIWGSPAVSFLLFPVKKSTTTCWYIQFLTFWLF